MINPNLYVSSLTRTAVRVTSLGDATKFSISWDAQPLSEGYRVYAGFDPFYVKSLISGSDPLPVGTTEFPFTLPDIPPTQIVYFWVGSVEGGTIRFLDEMGSYHLRTIQYEQFANNPLSPESQAIMCAGDQRYFIEEMRRRAKAVLEDTSEEVDLYIKQWRGLPDPTTQDELGLDPNYQGMSRDDRTYGVGFFPGFFPAIRIRLRFGGLPQSQFDYQIPGMRPLMDNMAWTIWDPILHENDLIVRRTTGLRYVVKENAFSNYRAVPISQRLTLTLVNPTSPLQKVNDTDVRAKWETIDGLGYARVGFNVLPSENADAKDYLLFN